MKVINVNKMNKRAEESVIVLGNFDGVHLGHRELIERAKKMAEEKDCQSSALLFSENSNDQLAHKKTKRLTSLFDKMEIMGDLGLDIIYIIDFDQEFMKLSPDEFLKGLLFQKLSVIGLVVGHDYSFGYKAEGDVAYLKKVAQEEKKDLTVVDPVYSIEDRISSTRIREAIGQGKIEEANEMLGRPYRIRGRVIDGDKRGRILGFPTANIENSFYVVPKNGVYATLIELPFGKFMAMTNIGYNPTFTDQKILKIEANILDFDYQIYGLEVVLYFYKFMRDDIKFSNKEDLICQMKRDREDVKKYFESLSPEKRIF